MRSAAVAILALMAWALPSAAAQAIPTETKAVSTAALAAGKPGLKKALKKCRRISNAKRRKTCVGKARKRFGSRPEEPVEPEPGKAWRVDVLDDYLNDYFSPDFLEIKAGDRIEWVWSDENQNPHDVSLFSGPPGVNRFDYATPNSPSRDYTWSRQLDVPGMWTFACSLHQLMRMTVKVVK